MQCRVSAEIARDDRVDAMKFAFDAAFAGFLSQRQYDFLVTAL